MNDLLSGISQKSTDNEFYNPIPLGYTSGKTKFVVVTGTVMSGLGKGIFASSLAKLLQLLGLKVSIMKFDGYLNVDAGTLNPFRHGEVFVLDDGTESDMDLGTYERFLGIKLTKNNYLTGGKVFTNVLKLEREGKYLGKDVQFIPHVTGEIKRFVRQLALSSQADVVFVEVGGTIGDIENNYFIEAMRELRYEEGPENVATVGLTYVLEPGFLGEQKSKAAQLGLRAAMSAGLNFDVIACRCDHEVSEKIRQKISVAASVPLRRVVSVHDVPSIYLIPSLLRKERLDEQVVSLLEIGDRAKENHEQRAAWENYALQIQHPQKTITIGMTGKYTALRDSYASILKALEHAGTKLHCKVNVKWIETTNLKETSTALTGVQGIIVPGAFGSRGAEGKITCIQHARTQNLPYLGLCYGFQMAIIEYARNVCNLTNANSTEINPETPHPVIDILPEQKQIEKLGGNMRLGGQDVEITPNSKAAKIYCSTQVRERFRHRWECNQTYLEKLKEKGLVFSGKAVGRNIMQILELPQHPFFVGTQFHPEYLSRPLQPHPLYVSFLQAALQHQQ